MRAHVPWLSALKAAELHKLAVSIGTPCSGTKAVQVQGIEHALASLPRRRGGMNGIDGSEPSRIKVVSIDMGIRNLAYSAWTSEATTEQIGSRNVLQYERPILRAWRKIDVSSTMDGVNTDAVGTAGNVREAKSKKGATSKSRTSKESFEPIDYANRAYEFVKAMLAEHDPSHVLIERQRFRTGGNSAVQEWTIRVGVFEGMLYAVLRSLVAQNDQYQGLVIEPVLPARVNRYWLENVSQSKADGDDKVELKITAREVKQMKISLVKDLLATSGGEANEKMFGVDPDLTHMTSAFLSKSLKGGGHTNPKGDSRRKNSMEVEISKLDDLADCFLQGLAWTQWYNNRLQLDILKAEAIAPLV